MQNINGFSPSTKMPIKLKKYPCNDCKIDGVFICTATKSGKGCDRGALTLEEARERKRHSDLMWQNYLKRRETC